MRWLSPHSGPHPLRATGNQFNRSKHLVVMTLMTVVTVLVAWSLPRIPQNLEYHQFADQRPFLGLPYGLDVLSNLGFLAAGGYGLWRMRSFRLSAPSIPIADHRDQWPFYALLLGTILTGLGSAYYHACPDNARLVWDRLPMTMIFMSFLAQFITQRISVRAGLMLLIPLLIIGVLTVIYWQITEQRGMGDLRPYGVVHYYPIALVLYIIWAFPSEHIKNRNIFIVFGIYGLATVCEVLDHYVFATGRVVSGHTLKHGLASLALFWHIKTTFIQTATFRWRERA